MLLNIGACRTLGRRWWTRRYPLYDCLPSHRCGLDRSFVCSEV